MFTQGFEKTAGIQAKKILKALQSREMTLEKTIKKITSGNKVVMRKHSPTVKKLTKYIKNPISEDFKKTMIDVGLDPETEITGLKRNIAMRNKPTHAGGLGGIMDHIKLFNKLSKNPLAGVKQDANKLDRRKKHYASLWADISKNVSAEIKKSKPSKTKKKK